jgi:hypothetical protein
MQINYDDIINNLKISYSDIINNMTDGVKFLFESHTDGISYNKTKEFLLFNVAVLEKDNNGYYFHEYSLEREGDIIYNFNFDSTHENVRFHYIIDGYKYEIDELDEFIIVAAPYSEIKIRVTFLEELKMDNELKISYYISYKIYLFNKDIRNFLINNPIKTKSNIYTDGICYKIDN